MIYFISVVAICFAWACYVDISHDKHIDILTECGYAAVRGFE